MPFPQTLSHWLPQALVSGPDLYPRPRGASLFFSYDDQPVIKLDDFRTCPTRLKQV